MNFIKILTLISLPLGFTCSGLTNKSSTEVDKQQIVMSEIVIYINSTAKFTYKDGSFHSIYKNHEKELNEILNDKQLLIKSLTTKDAVNEENDIFYVNVNKEFTKQLLKDLKSLPFITAAYVKPEAEDPFLEDLEY